MIAEGNTFFLTWEVSLMQWLQSHLPAAWLSAVSAFSMFGEELVLIVILGLIYFQTEVSPIDRVNSWRGEWI